MFLALGLGILMGTTVLDDSLVDSLRRRTDELQRLQSDLRDQLVVAEQDVAQLDRATADLQPFVLPDLLTLQPVVLVTTDGADANALDEAATVLDLAGARVVATITVQSSMTAASPSDAQDLAALLGVDPGTPADELMSEAAGRLAARLASGQLRAGDGQDDLLGRLLSDGFVVAPGVSDANLAEVGGPSQIVVTVGGGTGGVRSASEGFLAPFVADLVDRELIAVAAEGSDPESTFISATRDRTGGAALITVDGLDHPVGGTALVLAIDGAKITGEGGAFGMGEQASQPFPAAPA